MEIEFKRQISWVKHIPVIQNQFLVTKLNVYEETGPSPFKKLHILRKDVIMETRTYLRRLKITNYQIFQINVEKIIWISSVLVCFNKNATIASLNCAIS